MTDPGFYCHGCQRFLQSLASNLGLLSWGFGMPDPPETLSCPYRGAPDDINEFGGRWIMTIPKPGTSVPILGRSINDRHRLGQLALMLGYAMQSINTYPERIRDIEIAFGYFNAATQEFADAIWNND